MPPWELIQDRLLFLLAPAFFTALLVGWLTLRVHRGGVAVLAGLLAGNLFLMPLPWWPVGVPWSQFLDEAGWPLLLIASAIATLPLELCGDQRLRIPSRRLGAGVWVALVTFFLATSPLSSWELRAGTALVSFLLFIISHRTANNLPRWLPFTGYAATGLAGAVVLIHACSALYCDLGLLFAASLAGIALATRFSQGQAGTAFAPATLYLPALMFSGQQGTYSEVPSLAFALVALAPLAQLIAWGFPSRFASKKLTTAVALAWLASLVSALVLAMNYETLTFE